MITVVTDSTVYMTREQAAKLGTQVVPMRYSAGGQQYLESYSDCNGKFEGLLTTKPSTTAQVPVSAFVSVFEEIIRNGNQVLCLLISSRLSGAYRSASMAARQVNKGRASEDVMVVDSQTTAGGLFLLCKQAAYLVQEGLELREMAAQLENFRSRVGVAFSLDSMDALRKSGRIGIVRQSVSTILNIRPILKCQDGAVVSCGTARGREELIKGLFSCVPLNAEELVLNFLNPNADTALLEHELQQIMPNVPLIKNRLGPVLSIHLGKGAIGLSYRVPAAPDVGNHP